MRIVSLVPSLTETLFALGLGVEDVVGRTAWCVRPGGTVDRIRVVGGTKTPNLRAIKDLAPDLVVLEREENRKEHFEELAAEGIRTWVTHVVSGADVPPMLEELGRAVGKADAGRELAARTRAAVEEAESAAARLGRSPVAVPLIWNDPLMAVAPSRYGGDLVRRAGFTVPDPGNGEGYPRVSPRRIGELGVEVLLLTSEPHDFTAEEGEAIAAAVGREGFPRPRTAKVDGQALTWFGARTPEALAWWMRFRAES